MREFAEQLGGLSVVGASCFCFVVELAEVVGFVIALYLGLPFFASFVPVDAFVFGSSV